ncbi:MAG: hypothetical protein WAV41_00715 [Microgenomates group bacterium]
MTRIITDRYDVEVNISQKPAIEREIGCALCRDLIIRLEKGTDLNVRGNVMDAVGDHMNRHPNKEPLLVTRLPTKNDTLLIGIYWGSGTIN